MDASYSTILTGESAAAEIHEMETMGCFTDRITPMILTYNEAPNIQRTLDRLTWARQILVIDSYSTDDTPAIVRRYPQTVLVQRQFDTHAAQCNFGLQQVESEWVLSMDADYVLSDELIQEIARCDPAGIDGYVARFRICVHGKPLRSGLYPPRTVLYRREKARYWQDGHTQRVHVDGRIDLLRSCIYHDDRKPLMYWLQSQQRYISLEAQKLLTLSPAELSLVNRIRKTKVLAPILMPLYCLFARQGVLDGWRGWHYALQRSLTEGLLALCLIEASAVQAEHRNGSKPHSWQDQALFEAPARDEPST